jgi:hypothetical protein
MKEENHVLDGIDLPFDQTLFEEILVYISKHKKKLLLNTITHC